MMYLRRRYGAWAGSMPPRNHPVTRLVSLTEVNIQPNILYLTTYTANNPYSPSRQPDASTLNDTAWPKAFLSDFGSRIWITYRSNFTPIPRTKSLEATSSMTLGVRLRSQLMDPQGFTSDTGWGCMIRSGQSLLANTFSVLLLGRGERCV